MNINQGEIWLVHFYPQVGSEISKLRPAIVISSDTVGKLPLKTIVPLTDWSEKYSDYPWMIKIINNSKNGLSKTSAIDCFQIKNFSDKRFEKKIGKIDKKLLKRTHQTVVKTFDIQYELYI